MVGVGGFLGLGEREVKIAWSDLRVENYGEQVMVNMTKDELKATPEYKYGDTSWRGQVFSDKGPWPAADSNRSGTALVTHTDAKLPQFNNCTTSTR